MFSSVSERKKEATNFLLIIVLYHVRIFPLTVTMDRGTQNSTNYEFWEYMFTLRTPEGWVGGSAGITGILLLIILGIIFVLSQPFVREKGYFEVC